MCTRIIFLSWICCFLIAPLHGQIKENAFTDLLTKLESFESRPKIGLALSGGAAHGLAHIGVIKYLEEQGVYFDYVTGTSMGSIIGGLLAMGYNADQITKIASSQNWPLILSNYLPLNEISPTEKFEHNKFPLQLSFDGKSLSLPKGFLAGQKLDMLISRLYSPAYGIQNFDNLSIPFRCFAVDVVTGNVETLKSGYLGRAIRASMAIPTVFNPVEDDGKLLVDGGLIRNFPVKDNYEMGADLVIGVYVGSKLEPKEKLKSLFEIMRQSAVMLSIKDSELQKKLCSIFIEPQVKDFDAFSFVEYEELILKGYEEAKKYEIEIKAIAEKLNQFGPKPIRNKLKFPDPHNIDFVRTTQIDSDYEDLLKSKLSIQNGDIISIAQLEDDIAKIYGTKIFRHIGYSLYTENEKNILEIFAPPKESIDLGINVNYFYSTNSSILLNAQIRNKWIKPSRLFLTTRISQFPAGALDFVYRLGRKQSNAVGIESSLERYKVPLFFDNDIVGEYFRFDSKARLKWIWEPDNANQLNINFGVEKNEFRRNIIREGDFNEYEQLQFRFGVEHLINTLDDGYFPTKGWSFKLQAGFNFGRDLEIKFMNEEENIYDDGTNQFIDLSLLILKAINVSPRFNSYSQLSANYFSKDMALAYAGFGGMANTKNGHFPFIGAHEFQYNLSRAVMIRQSIYYDLTKNIHLGVIANYLYGKQYLSSYLMPERPIDKFVSTFGYGLSLGLKTPIGPLFFDIGVANQSAESSIGIGHRFLF